MFNIDNKVCLLLHMFIFSIKHSRTLRSKNNTPGNVNIAITCSPKSTILLFTVVAFRGHPGPHSPHMHWVMRQRTQKTRCLLTIDSEIKQFQFLLTVLKVQHKTQNSQQRPCCGVFVAVCEARERREGCLVGVGVFSKPAVWGAWAGGCQVCLRDCFQTDKPPCFS